MLSPLLKTPLTVVVPCFNEEAGIPQLRNQLAPVLETIRQEYELELLFIDDGSTDETVARIRALWPDAEPRIVLHGSNQGLGAALRTGAAQARGELVLFIDSDCTYRPQEIPGLLSLLTPDVDIVTASPYHRRGGWIGVPGYRLFLSQTLSLLYQTITGSGVATYTSMFRVYRREALWAIPRWSNGYVALAETLILPMLAGYRVREFPTVLHTRRYSRSKIFLLETIRRHLGFIAYLIALKMTRRLPVRRRDSPKTLPLRHQ